MPKWLESLTQPNADPLTRALSMITRIAFTLTGAPRAPWASMTRDEEVSLRTSTGASGSIRPDFSPSTYLPSRPTP